MTGIPSLWLGIAALAGAYGTVLALVVGRGRVVPLARRRPVDAVSPSALTRSAGAAAHAAGAVLGRRAGRLENSLEQAGLRVRPQDFLVLVASGMVVLFALGLLVWGPAGGVLMLLAGPLLAWGALRVLTARRRRAFAWQLGETLSVLAGSLRAGYSLPQACATLAAEAEAPTSEEFTRVINEARVGRTFIDALGSAAARVRNDDFHWVVQAVAINREVGGNLADVLEGVGTTIRERTQLTRQVDALAAEGRLSAVILGALPVVVFLALSVANPAYVARFGESAGGVLMLVVSGILMGIGLLWLRAVVRIKY